MASWNIIAVIILGAALTIDCKILLSPRHTRETAQTICEPTAKNIGKIHCFCRKDYIINTVLVVTAECWLANKTEANDPEWKQFETINSTANLIFTNARQVNLTYIPTIFKALPALLNINIKYGDIERVEAFAFANISSVEEIKLTDNKIKYLKPHAFANHLILKTLNLDKNEITEIERGVFHNLPSLKKLFLTENKITTIHDKAFINLLHLQELELDKNKIFSLNSETFSGLINLNRIDLSDNSLEVIGDNTFLPLNNLQSLSLDTNKIQMLDDKAFAGLSNLRHLSLSRNNITEIQNNEVFEGLYFLISLNLKSNGLRYLTAEVMAPIVANFYGTSSSFDFDDNEFSCDCRLEWFVLLGNRTLNGRLKLAVENLKCIPSSELSEKWKKFEETEKNTLEEFQDNGSQNGDYEYYDDSQLQGKLFFIDVRDLLNCTKKAQISTSLNTVEINKAITTDKPTTNKPLKTTRFVSSTTITAPQAHTTRKVYNHGTLDLALDETTVKTQTEATLKRKQEKVPVYDQVINEVKTTSKFPTVSPNPIKREKSNANLEGMASDEAVSQKLNADQRIQKNEEVPRIKSNSANKYFVDLVFYVPIICVIRLI